MALSPGTRLGVYEVTAQIGEGGMGQVYRARDTTLARDVAIKILPEAFEQDPDRLARFQREARTLASLNHPNIAIVHGLEQAGDVHALVMELVDGDDLSQRIARGAIPLDEALPIARQIAEALEAAHEQGIIHRDLKPANIKVRADGTVKVLDFGLAKAMEPAGAMSSSVSKSPTMTTPAMTLAGMILGTAAYMSPEQARGRAVDTRTDIWAFGCVLFEMLSGTPPFRGSDVTEMLSAIIQLEPDYDRIPARVPAEMRRLIARCLKKNPKARLRDIGDARNQLAEIAEGSAGAASPPAPAERRWLRLVPWALVVLLGAALAATFARGTGDAGTGVPLRRFTIALPWDTAPNWNDFDAVISPDGARVAYNCREGNTVSLCVRGLDSLTAQPLADGRDLTEWFFSPDGEWIGFFDGVSLAKVSIHGGQPQTIHRWTVAETVLPQGFSWGGDGYILMGTASGLYRVAATGGNPEQVTGLAKASEGARHFLPRHLSDGRRALVTIGHADGSESAGLADLAQGTVRDLAVRGAGFVYAPTGHLVFQQGTTVLAASFDPDEPERVGDPVPLIENVGSLPRLAGDGTLVYIPTRGKSSARLVWVDRAGRPSPIAGERRDYSHLDLAPDGRRVLLNVDGGSIYVLDLDRGTRNLLAMGSFPIWSQDGTRVTFGGRQGLKVQPADGSGAAETLVTTGAMVVPTSWHPVTGDLAYYDHRSFEIWIRPGSGEPRRFLGAPGRKRSGRFSPDGKWLAYVSDETGEYQVYVTAYPGPGPTVAISINGGLSPIWSADGRELFFRHGGKVLAARLTGGDSLRVEAPVELFDGPYTLDLMGHQRDDVGPDGRFLLAENSDDFPIVVVQNWLEELKRLVPAK